MLPFLADDLRHLPRRPPTAARSRGILGSLPHLPFGAELWPLSPIRTRLGRPVRRLSHAGVDVAYDRVNLARPSNAGAGAHALDQGLAAGPCAMTWKAWSVAAAWPKPPAGEAVAA